MFECQLRNHSDMKNPPDDVMENIYKKRILNDELGVTKFGKYDLSKNRSSL